MGRARFSMAPEVRIWLDWKHKLLKSESERDEKLQKLAATKLTKVKSKYREYGYLDTSAIVSCGLSVKAWLRSDEFRTFLMPVRPLMWYETQGTTYVHTALRVKLEEWCRSCWIHQLRRKKEDHQCGGCFLGDKERYLQWIKEDDEWRQRQQQQQEEEEDDERQQQEDASNICSQSDSKDESREETVQSFACSPSTAGRSQRPKRTAVKLSAPSPYAVRILHRDLCAKRDKGDT